LTRGIVFNLNNTLATIIGQVEQLGVKVQDPPASREPGDHGRGGSEWGVRRPGLEGFASDKPGGGLVSCDIAGIVMESASLTQPPLEDEAELEGGAFRWTCRSRRSLRCSPAPQICARSSPNSS